MLNYLNKFETWVASWLPGAKTKILSALGALAALGAATQEYLTGIPLSSFIGETKALLTTAAVFTLTYWTRRLTDKE